MPAHVRAALTAVNLSIPVTHGRMGAGHLAGHLPLGTSPRSA